MGIQERKLRQKEEVRDRILDAAWQLVKEEGWQALSIRKIADAIEYSVPVVYDHFENKEAILFELSLNGFRLLQHKLCETSKKHKDPKERLKALANVYWNFAFKNQAYYQLMYGVGMPCCGAGKMKPEVNAFRDFIGNDISEIITANGNDMEEACFKTHALWSVIHGLISIMIMRNSDIDSSAMNKKVMEDTVDAVIKSL
jgi:AcrR family transcriptional regulator